MYDVTVTYPIDAEVAEPIGMFEVPPREGELIGLVMMDGRREWFTVAAAFHFPRTDGAIGYSIHIQRAPDDRRPWTVPQDYAPQPVAA